MTKDSLFDEVKMTYYFIAKAHTISNNFEISRTSVRKKSMQRVFSKKESREPVVPDVKLANENR